MIIFNHNILACLNEKKKSIQLSIEVIHTINFIDKLLKITWFLLLLCSPIPTCLPGQIAQEVDGYFCYAVNKEGYFCILHDSMKWSSIRESSCQCNGSISAVSSYAKTESKDLWVLLLYLELAFESKWMTCSAGTYLNTSSDFWAGAKLLFFPLCICWI